MADSIDIGPCSPFLIVADVTRSLAFYVEKLGLECRHAAPEGEPFFAIVGRGAAQIMLKCVGEAPLPNAARHAEARWDAFVYVSNPDALAGEYTARNVTFRVPLADTEDGLRGFELADPDGYVCFFGRPN